MAVGAGPPMAYGAGDDEPGVLRDYLGGNGLLNRGLYELAADEYRKFLKEHGEHEKAPLARYGLAVCLYHREDYEAAGAELVPLTGLSDFPFAAEVLAMSGQCHLTRGRYEPAAEMFRRLLSKHRGHDLADDAAALLVETLYLDGKYDEAVAAVRRFEKRWPNSPLGERVMFFGGSGHMGQGDWPAAIARFSLLLKDHPKSRFGEQVEFLLARCHDRNNALDEAVRWYGRVLERKTGGQVADALLALATIAQKKGEPAEAGRLLDRLLKEFGNSPLKPRALLLRGRAWFEGGQYERAAELFEQAGKHDEGQADAAAYWLAKCKLRTGQYAEAARRLNEALEAYPDSGLRAEMSYDRAVALVQAGDAESAAKALGEFRSQYPKHAMAADALQLLAAVEHSRERFDRSQEHCQAFLGDYGDHPAAAGVAFLAAENEFLRGRHADSVRRYEAFLKRYGDDPQAGKARFRRGMALYRLERYDEALGPLTEAAAGQDRDGNLGPAAEPAFRAGLLALGDLHFRRGEWKQAERWLGRYLAGGAEVPAADDALRAGQSIE